MDDISAFWLALFKATLKVIGLIVLPRPAVSFPTSSMDSNPKDIRYAKKGEIATPIRHYERCWNQPAFSEIWGEYSDDLKAMRSDIQDPRSSPTSPRSPSKAQRHMYSTAKTSSRHSKENIGNISDPSISPHKSLRRTSRIEAGVVKGARIQTPDQSTEDRLYSNYNIPSPK
ncbi:hypothetical protein H0H93_011660, partial [Arthromyces matolae]